MRSKTRAWAACVCAAIVLSACADDELILPGERLDLQGNPVAAGDVANRAQPLGLSAPRVNGSWTHRGGGPGHRIAHPAFSGAFTPIWITDIGDGNDRRHRLTADPVVEGGRIFTMDSRATVTALSTAGEVLWQRDLTPPDEKSDDASGGGLAVSGGRLFVTSSFGFLTTLDAATGRTLWTQRLDAAAGGPPTVQGETLYLVTSDSRAWAIDVRNGRVRWNLPGAPSQSGLIGGPSVAVAGDTVLLPFSSGQLIGARRADGERVWATSVAGQRDERVFSRVLDIQGDPVVVGSRAFIGNSSGRTVALNIADGERIWTATDGSLAPVVAEGNSIFLVSDQNELLRLNAATGERLWSVPLPFYQPVRRNSRLKDAFVHYGPVLAGGRLIVASDDELIRVFNPVDGTLLRLVELPEAAARNPVVAGGTLYLVTADGRLRAFR